MADQSTARVRHKPKQDRSREIVRAICEAGLKILEKSGPLDLTTNHIAEVAGVSIGSLYRYFPDKEAVIAAIYEAQTEAEADSIQRVENWTEIVLELPLRGAIRLVVEVAAARHRRFQQLGGDFYRNHHKDFSLGREIGTKELSQVTLRMLEAHRHEFRDCDLNFAAFLMMRGISALMRSAVEDDPEFLKSNEFLDECENLMLRYLGLSEKE